MVQLSGNNAPPPTNAGSSSPNSCAEIAELLSRLQFDPPQLQELFVALTNIATSVTKAPDNETYDVINADDVSRNVSSKGTGDENTDATSRLPTTAAPSTVAAEDVVASPSAASDGESVTASTASDTDSVPGAPIVSAAPPADVSVGTTVVAAPPVVVAPAAPVSIAAPAATSTTRVFNGVSYQYPATGGSGPFYLVTRGRDIGVFVGWENTSPLITRVSASVSFRIPSAEEGRVRMENSIAAGFARRL
ncbi:hypothetical protein K443DRAFT_111531 [Laccaria amethystina LaAM-08-1]|uniref:Uncharacterized protein n=1 Tax=Laccaria amethystina LaAM-08-1 TaxID=1095629 RepID=A0A0C9X827_9AGAR|nr:hypothetical protein K443DRAFT_111531 [Laccaria amethystina LaAM-08-1]